MCAYIKNHPELLDKEMQKENIPEFMRPVIQDFFVQSAPNMIRDSAPKMAAFAESFYLNFADSIADIAKNAHNKVLSTDFSEAK